MEGNKDNMGLIIVVIIGLMVVIGIIAYMLMSGKSETDMIDNNVEEKTTITMEDIAGSYYGTFEISDKSVLEEGKDAVEEAADDVKDTITGEDNNDTNNTTDDNNGKYRIELLLNTDGTAKMVNTDKSETVINGKYTLRDKMITFTQNSENGVDEDTTDKIMFTVSDSSTLTYKYDGVTINLIKTNNLKYIK